MKNFALVISASILLLIISGCPSNSKKTKNVPGRFPEKATNLNQVNSQYDDYNSAYPGIHFQGQLIFSSNRSSYGDNFDIIYKPMQISWNMESELLGFRILKYEMDSLVNRINSSGNEFGPNIISQNVQTDAGIYDNLNLITYSSMDDSGCYQTYCVFQKYKGEVDSMIYGGPFEVNWINNLCNAQYLTLKSIDELPKEIFYYGEPLKYDQIYFQADGEGLTDIFVADLPEYSKLEELLISDTALSSKIVEELSTAYEDKCPFINGRFMVFSSNRPGGLGGYDLYYSFYENGSWSSPVNFGENINSASDEFRPISIFAAGFETDLMIFSSNRHGGHGGFDLYYVGLPFKFYE